MTNHCVTPKNARYEDPTDLATDRRPDRYGVQFWKERDISLYFIANHAATMNVKPSLNYERYIGILQQMTPEQRLSKALELSEFGKALFVHGLRKRFPLLSDEEFNKKLRERLDKCHNRNY